MITFLVGGIIYCMHVKVWWKIYIITIFMCIYQYVLFPQWSWNHNVMILVYNVLAGKCNSYI